MKRKLIVFVIMLVIAGGFITRMSFGSKMQTGTSSVSFSSVKDSAGAVEEEKEFGGDDAQEEGKSSAAKERTDEVKDTVFVHICGEVKSPGVYEVSSFSRVDQVLEAAGGFTRKADAQSVNLARIVEDGEQIVIPRKNSGSKQKNLTIQEESPEAGEDNTAGTLVNINTADVAKLTGITGIGQVRAQAIVSYREENGSFSSVEQIMLVPGIKEGIFRQIKNQICV